MSAKNISPRTAQILTLANGLGACTLDGIPAKLDLSGRLPRVIDTTGRSAVFNPSVSNGWS